MVHAMIMKIGFKNRRSHTKISSQEKFILGLVKHVQAPVVQRLDNAIHRINHYPVDSVVCFINIYPLDSDLSGG